MTSKIERLPSEMTPAPLPPSPAADAADTWFEQVPTNPAAVPDLAALSGSRPDIATPPGWASRQSPPPGALDPWKSPSALYNQSGGTSAVGRKQWLIPGLIAATALVIGMVFGALLFAGGGSGGGDKSDEKNKSAVPTIEQCEALMGERGAAAPKGAGTAEIEMAPDEVAGAKAKTAKRKRKKK